MSRCQTCGAKIDSRFQAAVIGSLIGLALGAMVVASCQPVLRWAMGIPEPVPLSALESCQQRLERYAEVAAVADAIDNARRR